MSAAIALAAAPAVAGPPYATDDPVPTDTGHWENFLFVGGSHAAGTTEGEAGIDLNYGVAEDMQLTIGVPIAYERGPSLRGNLGRLETGLKYRCVHQDDQGWRPEFAVFPAVIWPTATGSLDDEHATVRLPIWVGREAGPWSVFGGAAYEVNSGQGRRDTWFTGLAVTREIGERGSLGGEIFHETASTSGEADSTGGDLGFEWHVVDHWSLMGSVGPTDPGSHREAWSFYLALKALY